MAFLTYLTLALAGCLLVAAIPAAHGQAVYMVGIGRDNGRLPIAAYFSTNQHFSIIHAGKGDITGPAADVNLMVSARKDPCSLLPNGKGLVYARVKLCDVDMSSRH